jgi:hypothetical protein
MSVISGSSLRLGVANAAFCQFLDNLSELVPVVTPNHHRTEGLRTGNMSHEAT